MATNVKAYLMEKGVKRELAVELDEIVLAMHLRMARLKKQGVEKGRLLMDIGKYQHLERKSPHAFPEAMRMAFDVSLLTLNFADRLRILEHYDIIRLNVQTGEYEFTDLGRQFYPQP